jgi:DNA-binding phage protein
MDEILKKYVNSESNMKQVAEEMGISYTSLMRKLNENDGYKLNIFEVVKLIKATGNYEIVHHICKELNLITIPINVDSDKFNVEGIAEFTKETGEAMIELSKALSDNEMSRQEAIRCTVP